MQNHLQNNQTWISLRTYPVIVRSVLVLLVCGLSRKVALQQDLDRAPQVCDISADILFSMYVIRLYSTVVFPVLISMY